MRGSILKEFAALLALSAMLGVGFYALDFGPDDSDTLIPLETETRLGGLLMDQLLVTTPEVNSIPLDDAMATISDRLLRGLKDSKYYYRFIVVDTETVNAYTLPGGTIIVFSGLIEFTKSPEELAAVLAHEIGHAEKNHVTKKLIKQVGLEVLMGSSSGGDTLLLSELVKTMASLVFDRAQEQQADEFAMELLLTTKINPRTIASFFRRVREKQSSLETELELLSNHPETGSRIRAALQYNVPPNTQFESFAIDWERVQKSLVKSAD
ncbi:MAG: M48 family metallopeptidase [Proteobacteria bacterium]|nr:M48 family metallopeptidase [Pseudomonadota bacterium]